MWRLNAAEKGSLKPGSLNRPERLLALSEAFLEEHIGITKLTAENNLDLHDILEVPFSGRRCRKSRSPSAFRVVDFYTWLLSDGHTLKAQSTVWRSRMARKHYST